MEHAQRQFRADRSKQALVESGKEKGDSNEGGRPHWYSNNRTFIRPTSELFALRWAVKSGQRVIPVKTQQVYNGCG